MNCIKNGIDIYNQYFKVAYSNKKKKKNEWVVFLKHICYVYVSWSITTESMCNQIEWDEGYTFLLNKQLYGIDPFLIDIKSVL